MLPSMALSESVIFASIGGVGIAILLKIDPQNHFFSQSLRSIEKTGVSESLFFKVGVSESPFYSFGICGSTSSLI